MFRAGFLRFGRWGWWRGLDLDRRFGFDRGNPIGGDAGEAAFGKFRFDAVEVRFGFCWVTSGLGNVAKADQRVGGDVAGCGIVGDFLENGGCLGGLALGHQLGCELGAGGRFCGVIAVSGDEVLERLDRGVSFSFVCLHVGEQKFSRGCGVGVGMIVDHFLQGGRSVCLAKNSTSALFAAFFHALNDDVGGACDGDQDQQDNEKPLVVFEKLLELAGTEIDFRERGD